MRTNKNEYKFSFIQKYKVQNDSNNSDHRICNNLLSSHFRWLSKHCVEYIVDMRKQKQWQWFDNHEF